MNTYSYAWKRYLPVIRLLLKRSATSGIQTVKLDIMDFNKVNRKSKLSLSFRVEVARGRMLTINASPVARELFEALLEDSAAKAFILLNKYEISLNSNYELKIENTQPEVTGDISQPNAEGNEAS